jgi:hypothetical protein
VSNDIRSALEALAKDLDQGLLEGYAERVREIAKLAAHPPEPSETTGLTYTSENCGPVVEDSGSAGGGV